MRYKDKDGRSVAWGDHNFTSCWHSQPIKSLVLRSVGDCDWQWHWWQWRLCSRDEQTWSHYETPRNLSPTEGARLWVTKRFLLMLFKIYCYVATECSPLAEEPTGNVLVLKSYDKWSIKASGLEKGHPRHVPWEWPFWDYRCRTVPPTSVESGSSFPSHSRWAY